MFTGLIEQVGTVAAVEGTAAGLRLRIQAALTEALAPGESLAIDGVCLTIAGRAEDGVDVHVGPATARLTTLGSVAVGGRVNLERALRADGRLGGHFVQGHVDGMGTVRAIRQEGESHWLAIAVPAGLQHLLVPRGSIAVDGVSLTVAELLPDGFEAMIVPFTWTHTNLSSRRVGDRVNLECDLLGKYVARAIEVYGTARRPAGRTAPAPVHRRAETT